MKVAALLAASACALTPTDTFNLWKAENDVAYNSPKEEQSRFAQWQTNKVSYDF